MAGWKTVDEIKAYTLCVRLRDDVFRVTRTGRSCQDLDLRRQLRRSSASCSSNICEGFERFSHGEFGFFVGIAKASLAETIHHLHDGKERGYFTTDEHARLTALAQEAKRATTGLLKYLLRTSAPGEHRRRNRHQT